MAIFAEGFEQAVNPQADQDELREVARGQIDSILKRQDCIATDSHRDTNVLVQLIRGLFAEDRD